MTPNSKPIKVSPEQKAKALRDAARNSNVKIVRSSSSRSQAQGKKTA